MRLHCVPTAAGGHSAILEIGDAKSPRFSWAGFSSWVAWRSAYLTRIGTLKHRLYVASNWTLTLLFGRRGGREGEGGLGGEWSGMEGWGGDRLPMHASHCVLYAD